MKRRWMIVLLVTAVLAAGGAVTFWRLHSDDQTRLSAALELAPKTAVRFSWTDWAGVRKKLDADLDANSSGNDVADFLSDAFDHDLSSNTALEGSAIALQDDFGLSPAVLDWELFTQGSDGALVFMALPEGYDVGELRDRLRTIGFDEPAKSTGVWRGGVDLLAGLRNPVTPELAAVAIDEDNGLVVGSDDPDYLARRSALARGDKEDGVSQAAAALGSPLSASTLTGDQACSALAMTDAGGADRTRASELIQQAGGVHPMTGFAIAAESDGDVRVAMAFESKEQARADADSRSELAAGPAPGQGGTFPERFNLGRVVATDRLLTMTLKPIEGTFVLSDLSDGPLLFATC